MRSYKFFGFKEMIILDKLGIISIHENVILFALKPCPLVSCNTYEENSYLFYIFLQGRIKLVNNVLDSYNTSYDEYFGVIFLPPKAVKCLDKSVYTTEIESK